MCQKNFLDNKRTRSKYNNPAAMYTASTSNSSARKYTSGRRFNSQ